RAADVVWRGPARHPAPSARVRGSRFEGLQARGSSCRTADEIRAGHQYEDRKGARSHDSADLAAARGRSDQLGSGQGVRLFDGIRPITRSGAAHDAIAGVTLASMNIPQVLGYTRIAGTPVVTGLYTVLLPLVAFAAFGSSRHLVVAADSATAAIFSNSLSPMAAPGSDKYMAFVGMVALLTAGFLLVARVLQLGFLADFLSRTVLVGFLTGVGVQVGVAMLGDMLGVAVQSHRTLGQGWEILQGLSQVSAPTPSLSALLAASIPVGPRFSPALPGSLVPARGAIDATPTLRFPRRGRRRARPVA